MIQVQINEKKCIIFSFLDYEKKIKNCKEKGLWGQRNCVCSAGLFLGSSGTVPRGALASLSRGCWGLLRPPSQGSRALWFPGPSASVDVAAVCAGGDHGQTVMGSILVSSMTLQKVTFPRRCAILMSLRLETWTQTKGKHPTMRLSLPVNWELETSLIFSLWAWQCVMFTDLPTGWLPFPSETPKPSLAGVWSLLCQLSLFFWSGLCYTCYLNFLDTCWVLLTWKGWLQWLPRKSSCQRSSRNEIYMWQPGWEGSLRDNGYVYMYDEFPYCPSETITTLLIVYSNIK